MSVVDSWQPEQNRRDNLPERTMADVLALPQVCWLLGTSVLAFDVLHLIERAFLPKPTIGRTITSVQNALTFCCSAYVDKGEIQLVFRLVIAIKQRVCLSLHALLKRVLCWIRPPTPSLVLGTLADMTRAKAELIAENALLRQQLIILHRQIKRPVYRKTDRLLLVLLATIVRTWKQALFLVQPETLLRWHRELFRVFWKHKSKAHSRKPRLSLETITPIKEMAANNRLWGAERIRGELLKLNIRASKRTIQKYMRQVRAISRLWTELEDVSTQSCKRRVGL